jgi:hypothetical protein
VCQHSSVEYVELKGERVELDKLPSDKGAEFQATAVQMNSKRYGGHTCVSNSAFHRHVNNSVCVV